jgi:hypothetical protein
MPVGTRAQLCTQVAHDLRKVQQDDLVNAAARLADRLQDFRLTEHVVEPVEVRVDCAEHFAGAVVGWECHWPRVL